MNMYPLRFGSFDQIGSYKKTHHMMTEPHRVFYENRLLPTSYELDADLRLAGLDVKPGGDVHMTIYWPENRIGFVVADETAKQALLTQLALLGAVFLPKPKSYVFYKPTPGERLEYEGVRVRVQTAEEAAYPPDSDAMLLEAWQWLKRKFKRG